MCFSASASLVSSALLISSGIYCVNKIIKEDNLSAYLPIATIPLLFGIQQGYEGMLWLSLRDQSSESSSFYGLSFVFFSHFIWLFWMNLAAFKVETRPLFKKGLMFLVIIGFIYGGFLYFPLLFHPDWLSVNIVKNSLHYQIQVLTNGIISPYVGIFLYVSIALSGLWISVNQWLNYLGILLLIAFILTEFFFDYAFISVWCFFAALISSYLSYLFYQEKWIQKITNNKY